MIDHTFADVAVLGGGPAGCAAARLLAIWGHRVTLLTRPAKVPPLAESLTPSCGKLLERIGVLETVNGAGFVRSSGHTVRWGPADERVERFADGEFGWQVRRDVLDRVLLRAAQQAGARVRRHANVRRVEPAPDALALVAYEERGETKQLLARWIIDCTGRSGLMSRGEPDRIALGPRSTAVVGVWERRPDWGLTDESHTLVESYPGGWAWSVPVTAMRRQVTVMLDPLRTGLDAGDKLRLTYLQELARTKMLSRLCARGRFIGSPWARDASPYQSTSSTRNRVLLAGDAAAFVDPLSSFGMKKALATGWLAAVVVHSVMGDASLEAVALRYYAERAQAMVAALVRKQGKLVDDAASAHVSGFWTDRSGVDVASALVDPDLAALRDDPDVRSAFESIRSRPNLELIVAPGLSRVLQPLVEGHTIVLREHVVVPAFPGGIRYLRNVDLHALLQLAPQQRDVPSMFEAYNRVEAPVPLADFLGALAVLVGKGMAALA